jgi:hypothetical protein
MYINVYELYLLYDILYIYINIIYRKKFHKKIKSKFNKAKL